MPTTKERLYSLLRRSEAIFKTDLVYFAKGGFWLTLGQFLSSLTSFFLAIAFAHFLPRDTYGYYKYIISATGILSIFSLNGIDNALIQAVASGHEGSFMDGVRFKLRAGLVGGIASLGIALYYNYKGNTILSGGFIMAGLFLAFMNTWFLYDSLLQGQKRFRESTTYAVLSQIFSALVLGATISSTQNVYFIVLAYFASWTLARYFAYRKVVKRYAFNNSVDPKTISYGFHSSLIGSVAAISGSVDSILIFHYLGPTLLAVYTFALAPINQIKSLIDKIPTLAIPRFAEREVHDLQSQFPKRMLLLGGLAIIIFFSYYFFSPYFFQILFPKYLDSLPYSRVFAISILLWLPYSVIAAAISAKLTSIPRNLLYLWNLPGIAMTLFVFLLTPRFGIMGVISAKIISTCVLVLVGLVIWMSVRYTSLQTDSDLEE